MHPFWRLAPPPSPRWGDFILRSALSDERVFAVFYSAPCIGGSPVQPDRGASVASQSAECISSYMIHNDNPVTLALYSSPDRAIPQPSGPKAPSNLRTLRPIGPVHLKNLHARRAIRHHRTRRRPGAPLPQKNSPFGESIHKGEGSYLSLVRQRPRSQLRRKRRRCSISGVEGSSCSISRMASFSFRPERKMRRYAFFR